MIAFADVDHDVRVYQQGRGFGRDDDGLRAVCYDGWTLDSVTYRKILQFIDVGVLASGVEVHRPLAVDFIPSAQILRLDLVELLIDSLFQPFESLADATRSDIIDDDVPVRQREAEFLLMLSHESLAESPLIASILLLYLLRTGLDDHKRAFGTTVAHIKILFEVDLALLKPLLSQRSNRLLPQLSHLILQILPHLAVIRPYLGLRFLSLVHHICQRHTVRREHG